MNIGNIGDRPRLNRNRHTPHIDKKRIDRMKSLKSIRKQPDGQCRTYRHHQTAYQFFRQAKHQPAAQKAAGDAAYGQRGGGRPVYPIGRGKYQHRRSIHGHRQHIFGGRGHSHCLTGHGQRGEH